MARVCSRMNELLQTFSRNSSRSYLVQTWLELEDFCFHAIWLVEQNIIRGNITCKKTVHAQRTREFGTTTSRRLVEIRIYFSIRYFSSSMIYGVSFWITIDVK